MREELDNRWWAAKWISESARDGRTEHFIRKNRHVALFRTRDEARAAIQAEYGYIAKRPDLQQEPHGWRMPKPIRLSIRYRELKSAVGRPKG